MANGEASPPRMLHDLRDLVKVLDRRLLSLASAGSESELVTAIGTLRSQLLDRITRLESESR
jgi:hypothetical protein